MEPFPAGATYYEWRSLSLIAAPPWQTLVLGSAFSVTRGTVPLTPAPPRRTIAAAGAGSWSCGGGSNPLTARLQLARKGEP